MALLAQGLILSEVAPWPPPPANATAQRRGPHHHQPLTWPQSCKPPLFPRPLQWVV